MIAADRLVGIKLETSFLAGTPGHSRHKMRLIVYLSVILLIVATRAFPNRRYDNQHVWNIRGLKECRMLGEMCLHHYDCCGTKTVCRVLPGDDGPFSMSFRCDADDGRRFYYG